MSPETAYFLMTQISATPLGRQKTESKIIDTHEGSLTSHRPPTIPEDSDASDRRMPEKWGNVPGIDRKSRGPKVRAASSLLPLPSDNAVSIVSS
jgi:hypothetical protein